MSEYPKLANLTLKVPNKQGKLVKMPVRLQITENHIFFTSSPYQLKSEIKAMKGAKWWGFEDPPRKIWSVENCRRNLISLNYLRGENIYEWFERPLIKHEYPRNLYGHQKDLADHILTYHYCVLAASMGTGKSLAAISAMELSGVKDWFWVGPRSGLNAVEREFIKWEIDPSLNVEMLTYQGLTKRMKNWPKGTPAPQGVIFDECSRIKSPKAQRTVAAQHLADNIREEYGQEGYVVLMSGTPSPKSPCDWYSPCEVTWPGFLREGSYKAFEQRLGIFELKDTPQGKFYARSVWLDDEDKCAICGRYEDDEHDGHKFQKSINEVAKLSDRLKGLVNIKLKKDCLDLPDKVYRVIRCDVDAKTQRVAKALLKAAPNTMTGMTWLREFSSGWLYRTKQEGMKKCSVCGGTGKAMVWQDPERSDRIFESAELLTEEQLDGLEKVERDCPTCKGTGQIKNMVRYSKEVPSPKDEVLKELLEENEEQGRVVIFASFTGSIDKIRKICLSQGYSVAQVDGRGWNAYDAASKQQLGMEALDLWYSDAEKVAFVAHPASGGMGLTLTEARMTIFFDNSFNPEDRLQAEDRIHRIGMDNRGCQIVDIINLPTDERVLEVLKDNRRLELMTLGEFEDVL